MMSKRYSCPSCGSTHVRGGRVRSLLDDVRVLWGQFPARCGDCSTRFRIQGVGFRSIVYAQCPRCLRQNLSNWQPRHYNATRWEQLQLWLGARRWRCEVCRYNFVSLRPRLEKYVRPANAMIAEQTSCARKISL